MKKNLTLFFCGLLLFSTAFFSSGCEKEGNAEKAGKKIDQAFKDAKEKIDDAVHK